MENLKKIKKIPLWQHFKPKQFAKCQEREKLKNYRFVPFQPDALQKIPKKFKKQKKNTIRASFQAKIVLKRATKGENKNYRFVLFLPDALWKI